jgi:DNA helicase-2/ATP-dependent DNA helicase PcrA
LKGLGSNLLKSFLLYKKEKAVSYFDWLNANRDRFEDLINIIEIIEELLHLRNSDIIDECFVKCIELATIGNDSVTIENEKKSLEEFITLFKATDRVKTFVSLADMFWYHEQNGIAIRVELPVTENDESNCVFLSTIHGSKGLQYDKVYLIGCKNVNWEQRSNNEGIKVPDILNRHIVPEGDSHDDMRRLLYVACTRAKTGLYVSAYRKTDSGKDLSMTSLFTDFMLSENVDFLDVEDFKVPKHSSALYQVNVDSELMELIKERLMGFEISPTSTGTWEKCQNEFFYNALMKTPGTSAETPSFGTLFHNVLQRVAENYLRQTDPYFIDSLVEEEMEKLKINFHSTRIGRYKEYGKWLIKDYLKIYPFTKTPDYIEKEFHYEVANGAKVKGKLDRVELDTTSVKVVDYKTGRYKSTLKEFESFEEPGSQYWRQANIYSRLMHENFPDKSSYRFEFHYPEHESPITSFTYSSNDAFEEWLGNIWEKSQRLTFETVCKDPDCIYCANKLN